MIRDELERLEDPPRRPPRGPRDASPARILLTVLLLPLILLGWILRFLLDYTK